MKLNVLSALAASLILAACSSGGSDKGQGNDNAGGSSASSSSASSSTSSAGSSSASSSSASSSTSSSASSTSSSSSGAVSTDLLIQENQAGFCHVDGDPQETKNGGYSGDGYANADNYTGAGIIWAVNSAASQSVQLGLRFANGGTAGRPGSLTINDGSNGTHTAALPLTGGWTAWQEETFSVELVQGNNILALAATTVDGLANIDYLQLAGTGLSAGDCSSVSSSSSSSSSGSSSGGSSSGVVIGDGDLLPQSGNPVHSRYNKYQSSWSTTISQADIILSHQYSNGGWPKNQAYSSAGTGGSGNGTFDNDATTTEMSYMALMYNNTGDTRYRDSARKALQFIFDAQYDSGGWPQFYPLRNGYWDYVTFNDNAMSRVLTVLHHIVQRSAPYDTDVITDSDRVIAQEVLNKGVDFVLKSQWKQNGELTVWCAQHDPFDYSPKPARAYELESLSGSESVEIIGFLMTQPQTVEIETAVRAAIAWFRSNNTKVTDMQYVRGSCTAPYDETYDAFQASPGSTIWYRFYDLNTNQGFFSDRDGGKYYEFTEVSAERRHCYSWGGNYGEKIINYANSVGY